MVAPIFSDVDKMVSLMMTSMGFRAKMVLAMMTEMAPLNLRSPEFICEQNRFGAWYVLFRHGSKFDIIGKQSLATTLNIHFCFIRT